MSIAERAVTAGADVQVVGIVPNSGNGDARLIKLAASGVGHAAVLRTAARPLEGPDLELALRYLPDVHVVVAVDLDKSVLTAVVEGAAFVGAALIVVNAPAATSAADASLPATAIVLEAPATDPDDTFAGFVAALAGRLDAGDVAAEAWASTVRSLAVDPVS